ncbi:MAG: transketolase [Bacteroidales bacterium]|nr:transketolase [Bacteroidales bacterium]
MSFDLTQETKRLENIAVGIRRDIIRSLAAAGSGHLGGSLGLTDVFTCLYFSYLRHKPENPNWEERDRLILSVGHVAPVLYTALAHAGYFDPAELLTLRKLGSRLQGHPGKEHGLPGLEISSGSLGQGLSIATGLALAARFRGKNFRVVSVHGDGELQEGSIWEAAMSAAHHKLSNLVAIIDRNKVQIEGNTSSVMEIEPLREKWTAFGWAVFECNGNNIRDILTTFEKIGNLKLSAPAVILAHTLMGKGVGSIEGDYTWHGKAPDKDQAKDFENQLLKIQ